MRQVGVAKLMDLHHQQTIAAVAAVTVKAMIPKMTMRRMEIQPIRRWTQKIGRRPQPVTVKAKFPKMTMRKIEI